MKRVAIVAIGLLISVFAGGCMSTYYGDYDRERVEHRPEPISKEDVVALVEAGLSDEVIIDQIRATGSYFKLNKDDLIDLKNAGVTDEVISAMIKTSEPRQRRIIGYRNYPYSYVRLGFLYPYYSVPYYGYPYRPHFFGGHRHFHHQKPFGRTLGSRRSIGSFRR